MQSTQVSILSSIFRYVARYDDTRFKGEHFISHMVLGEGAVLGNLGLEGG